MQGACSNQIVKCIIYTSDFGIGNSKLLEIEKEKNANGIMSVVKRISKDSRFYNSEIKFSDGEEWIVVNPNDGARGYRWRKAWVDASNTSIAEFTMYIKPYGMLYQWEDAKFFNL